MEKNIAVIRIKGKIGLKKEIKETMKRLNLGKKYTCVIFKNPNEVIEGMIKKVRDFIAFGEIDDKTLKKLKEKREIKGKKYFRLHPPRGGIESKKTFGKGKGVLGDNKDSINKLIERML